MDSKNLKEENRAVKQNDITLGFGFKYREKSKSLLLNGKQVDLTKREHLLIYFLVKNLGYTLPYGIIKLEIWGTTLSENTRIIFLWRLRAKVGKELINTVTSVGYRVDK